MQYRLLTPDIYNYDLATLKEEAIAAGIIMERIHAGNGMLVFDVLGSLSAAEKTTLGNVISSHTPLWFTWMERGKTLRRMIRTAEDVDRVTAMRIRALLAREEDEPFEAQLKLLTKLVEGLYIDIAQATSLGDFKTRAQNRISPFQSLLTKRKAIIQQGKNFKIANNL